MTNIETRSSKYLTAAIRSHVAFTLPANHARRRLYIRAGFTASALCTVVALLFTARNTVQPMEATIQMERLAVKVELAKIINPETVREIAQIMSLPAYDCHKVSCSAQLLDRNIAARNRLKMEIARKTSERDVAGGKNITPLRFGPSATGSNNSTRPN